MSLSKFYLANRICLLPVLIVTLFLAACGSGANSDQDKLNVSPIPTAMDTVQPAVTPGTTNTTATPTTEPIGSKNRPTRTVRPEQLFGYIPNPQMGWQDTQPINKRFEETVGYRRINWFEVNPQDGVYDWSALERLRADMAEIGGTFSFRIRPAQPPPWGNGHTMPDWLVERGAMISETSSDILENTTSTEPLYSGCLFLDAQAKLIDAMRRRFDGDPLVAFIDIGSYGNYGEWGSEQYNDEPESLDWHARRRIIDMYIGGKGTRPCQEIDGQISEITYNYKGFQHTQLVMPYTPWFAESLTYALGRRADIGIRHDALGSETHQEKYREEIGRLVQQRWPYAPIIFEYYPEAYTRNALRSAYNFAEEMHASFIHENFDGRGDDELIEDLLEITGYRIVLREMTYTAEVAPGETITFEMVWENKGIAPPYHGTYPLIVSLTNALNVPVIEQQLDPDIREWLPGKIFPLSGIMQLPESLPAGSYNLKVAFVDPANNEPALALAISGRDQQGRYLIGPVRVLPAENDNP